MSRLSWVYLLTRGDVVDTYLRLLSASTPESQTKGPKGPSGEVLGSPFDPCHSTRVGLNRYVRDRPTNPTRTVLDG